MKLKTTALAGSCFTILFVFAIAAGVSAQDKAPKKADAAKPSNIQGTIQQINKTTSTINVRVERGPGIVVYNAATKFLYGHSDNNKPGDLAQVKEGYFISCGGTFDAKAQLTAQTCVYRERK